MSPMYQILVRQTKSNRSLVISRTISKGDAEGVLPYQEFIDVYSAVLKYWNISTSCFCDLFCHSDVAIFDSKISPGLSDRGNPRLPIIRRNQFRSIGHMDFLQTVNTDAHAIQHNWSRSSLCCTEFQFSGRSGICLSRSDAWTKRLDFYPSSSVTN